MFSALDRLKLKCDLRRRRRSGNLDASAISVDRFAGDKPLQYLRRVACPIQIEG
jgi:hypothetical protein